MPQVVPPTPSMPNMVEVETERKRLEHRKKYRATLHRTICALILVAAVSVLAATLFFPILQVSGTSMEPVLEDGDILLLWEMNFLAHGDLVGFYYQNQLLLKRVIGVPGDQIEMDPDGTVYVNGEHLEEPYVIHQDLGECDISFPYQVPEGASFVMGGNRTISVDSRSSAIGCISIQQVVGKVLFRIWLFPPKVCSVLGKKRQNTQPVFCQIG